VKAPAYIRTPHLKEGRDMDNQQLITFTADIVAAHVSNNRLPVEQVPELVQRVHQALAALGQPTAEEAAEKVPVVSVRASIKPDYLVCMECGAKQKMLKRHLQTTHGMTPQQYRDDYGLPATYPMVASNYSERRAELAKSIGLGRKPQPQPQPQADPGSAAGGNAAGQEATPKEPAKVDDASTPPASPKPKRRRSARKSSDET
jgi:predicted transcriptional regulator